ncbi:uncharacterized protein LOC143283207 [Babylonia areolata]|uniref:uncharacterized protein LOC143283207 n=1 Tax=Babylonia areolata TaxID=304850 RepID=UPI003FD2DC01
MASLAKRITESVLMCIHSSHTQVSLSLSMLGRSWEELEKRRFNSWQQLRHSKAQIVVKTQRSMQLLSSAAGKEAQDPESVFPKACIPGFRYKANGDPRQSTEDTRRVTLIKSFTGLSKHMLEKKTSTLQSRPVSPLSHKPSADSALNADSAAFEETECSIKKHTRPAVSSEENSSLRVRKVQEQLGLRSAHWSGQGSMDSDRTLEHAFKMLHLALRNPEVEEEKNKSQNSKSFRKKKKMVKGVISSACQSNEGTMSIHSTSRYERCGACKRMPGSDVKELVRRSDPSKYAMPRWRHAPRGRYVPTPLTTLHPAHPAPFHHSRAGGDGRDLMKGRSGFSKAYQSGVYLPSVKESVSSCCTPSTFGSFSHHTLHRSAENWSEEDIQSGPKLQEVTGDKGEYSVANVNRNALFTRDRNVDSSASVLSALKKRNSQENEALQEKMRQFVSSLPGR